MTQGYWPPASTRLMDELVQPALAGLQPQVIGREVLAFDEVDSTNRLLRRAAEAGAAEGIVVLADHQTAGRGRQGRSWIAPPGSSLLLSVLLRPTWLQPSTAFSLTMLAAVALAEAVEEATGLLVALKWPNDVQVAGRKLAGILVELEIDQPERVSWTIVGCGLNVSWQPDTEPAITQAATSIAQEIGAPVDRSTLLRAILVAFDRQYTALRMGRQETLQTSWRSRLSTLGRAVSVEEGSQILEGHAEDVAPDGALLVRLADGHLRRVVAGDVRVRDL